MEELFCSEKNTNNLSNRAIALFLLKKQPNKKN